jgi:hypothetical protein
MEKACTDVVRFFTGFEIRVKGVSQGRFSIFWTAFSTFGKPEECPGAAGQISGLIGSPRNIPFWGDCGGDRGSDRGLPPESGSRLRTLTSSF